MKLSSLIGRKIDQTQGFLEDGKRVPLSKISAGGNIVVQVKTQDHEGYQSVQLGFGQTKKVSKPIAGHLKKAGLERTLKIFREVRVEENSDLNPGTTISVNEVFEPGDIVNVVGTSKGKGFAGVVKRYGFAGGPRTHGQSDRERAPGSSGQGTTPGRVYRGKRMAGNMGNEQVTIKNLEVLGVDGDTLLVKGLIPGSRGSVVTVTKVGKNKKFVPLFSNKEPEVEAKIEPVEEIQVEEEVNPSSHEASEGKEEVQNEEKNENTETKEVKEDASE